MNFEEGFENDQFLFAIWNKFMDHLKENFSQIHILENNIIINIEPFYFFKITKELVQKKH